MITIVDYGMGNLQSVSKALEHLGHSFRFATTPAEIDSAERLVLPGVGAFGDAMEELANRNLIEPLRQYAASERPLMGICLGMQILFETSEEAEGIQGLELLGGSVKRFDGNMGLKVPHMGWNSLDVTPGSKLLAGLPASPYVYFVHSYYVSPTDPAAIAATCQYGLKFTAAVEKGNIFGTQFHPEKSQHVGLQILSNFCNLPCRVAASR